MRERLGLPLTVVLITAVAALGGSLAMRHREHLLAAGPILLLAGCALMHLLRHHGGRH